MPGELGNPDEQQEVGQYEHKYKPSGDDAPSICPLDVEAPPKSSMVMRVIKKMRDQQQQER